MLAFLQSLKLIYNFRDTGLFFRYQYQVRKTNLTTLIFLLLCYKVQAVNGVHNKVVDANIRLAQ